MIAPLILSLSLALASPAPDLSPRVEAQAVIGASMTAVTSRAQTPATGVRTPPEAAQPGTGLPERAPVPRTLADSWPVFLGFVIAWIAIVGHLLVPVDRRFARVSSEIERLETGEPQ